MTEQSKKFSTAQIVKFVFFGFVLAVIGSVFLNDFFERPPIDPFAELASMEGEGISDVEISASSECQKQFSFHLDTVQLKQFSSALKKFDHGYLPGHTGPFADFSITIKSNLKTATYDGGVYPHLPSDLFLRRFAVTPRKGGGHFKWAYQEVHVPDLGKWLIEIAPEGVRKSLETGSLAICAKTS